MRLRPEAEFRTELPDDMVEDDTDIVEFGGRGVTEALGKMLVSLSYEVSAPIYAGEQGWELDARVRGRRFWLQVSQVDGQHYRLSTKDMTW